MKEPFLVYSGHLPSVMLRSHGIWHTISQSQESRIAEEWKGVRDGCREEKNGVVVWSNSNAKVTIPVGLLKAVSFCSWYWIECGSWKQGHLPFTQIEVMAQLLVYLPFKQSKLLSLRGMISLKLYILLRTRPVFFLPILSSKISHHFRHHQATGRIQANELSNKNSLQLLRVYYDPGIPKFLILTQLISWKGRYVIVPIL